MNRLSTILTTLLLAITLLPSVAPAQSEAHAGSDSAGRRAAARLQQATAVNDDDGDKLFDELEMAFLSQPGERQPAIVLFTHTTSTAEGRDAVRAAAPQASVTQTFTVVPALVALVTGEEAEAIADTDEVRQLELDSPGTPELDEATNVMGADTAVEELGVTGDLDGDPSTVTTDDVGIAILDTGFFADHEQLDDGKLTAFVDLGDGRGEPYDDNGHGTHVANIAAGWGDVGGDADPAYRGVAPGAGIVGLKIEGGPGSEANAIAGFEWLVENGPAYNVRVATISYGFGTATDGTTTLELAVDAAWDSGITVFKSNGNSGPGYGTMTVPAAARGIIATGSLIDPFGTTSPGFSLSSFSSRGPTTDGRIKPDLAAPGDGIMAAQTGTRSGYVSKSGTSMASPFAAGTAALVIAANPALSPDEVRALLFATAEDFGEDGPDNDFGHGRIQVAEAVQAALASADAPVPAHDEPAVPDHDGVVLTADETGFATTTVEVTSGEFPLVATALGQGQAVILGVDLDTAADAGTVPGNLSLNPSASRQGGNSIRNPAVGTYQVRVLTQPLAQVAVAISHSESAPDGP